MAKKKKKEKKAMQVWKLYQASGNKLERKNRFCSKCGQGYFLAKHKDRETCGKCGFTEFISNK
ncbi:MAG: 30S ribosomal protein S27ae [Candidatus Woesearchaeota archaeon]|jgi:small subunit ribosomal protein S27Ae|nr:30S ribosomal protein S27ae [Candidatus Woesearchaeota archaeon]|tara:strand:+ start:8277 stop:8465 length:189 start_codon:yes stop_codon:yes gene_type:complete